MNYTKLLIFGGIFTMVNVALAQDMIVFPNENQSQEQQDKDRGECHVWAVKNTGYDPALASTPTVAKQAPKGGAVHGAARGAIMGVAVGAIAGDAGKGAAIGATAGGLGGAMRKRGQHRQQAASQQQVQAEQDAKQSTYRRALTACLEGKNYTVK